MNNISNTNKFIKYKKQRKSFKRLLIKAIFTTITKPIVKSVNDKIVEHTPTTGWLGILFQSKREVHH